MHDGAGGGRIRVVLGPHGADTCKPETLRAVRAEADARGSLITVHAAQSRSEVELIQKRYGMSPIEYLGAHGIVGPDVVMSHGVFATERDLEILRDSGTTIASCPLTFGRAGIAASFQRFRAAGVRTGVGTDGYSFDYVAELRAAGLVSKLCSETSNIATAPELIAAGTVTGADALHRPDLGRIEVGATADLTVISLSSPALQPVFDPLKSVVWYANARDVRMTMVDGSVIVEDGHAVSVDEEAVIRAGASAVECLWNEARNAGIDLGTPNRF
jgi:5-methylthioadenosine/S-adenosylhomocysteine deaminase